ncbi:MAG: three-Cys-motif partner protein TcmP [Erythrobacter sp.]|uniref:three-Cys-motif partner protein TcmP n=1 Tax=Erythrobacter sp. TaxID=1042 RepID=UPI0032ECF9C2
MSEGTQSFGGQHTRRKLDVVEKYLSAYVTVMKRQSFRLFYVDGFAGSGSSQAKSEAASDDPTLFPVSDVVEGSPLRALRIDPPFDHFLFIEKDPENLSSLERTCARFSDKSIAIWPEDANEGLRKFCRQISANRLDRAVVFLDPFGLSVEWDTIRLLAETEKVDLWYLVPVDGMSRQIKNDGSFLPGAQRIDRIWGSDSWREAAVRKVDTSDDLFGAVDDRLEKIARAQQFSEMFRAHLGEIFKGGVAPAYLPLGRGRRHDFSLMFACANPSRPAFEAAMRIANHILRTA